MDIVTLIVGGVIGLLVLETVAITLLVVGDRRSTTLQPPESRAGGVKLMWYRDYSLVQNRLQEIEREVREANFIALAKAGAHANQHRSLIRTATAAGVRRLGRAVISLSDRIDACAGETDAYAPHREPAFR